MKKFLCALCLVPIAVSAFAGDNKCATLTNMPDGEHDLQYIIRMGLCRNPDTAAAYLSAESARLSKNAAYGQYLPSVSASFSGSKRYQNSDWGDISANVGLSASWLIFDFGRRLENLNNLAAVWRATGYDYSSNVQNYVYSVVAGYYSLLSADGAVTVDADQVKNSETALATAKKQFSAGAVAKADVLKADTTLASNRVTLQQARGNREIAKGQLLTLLAFPATDNLTISDMPPEFGGEIETKTIEQLLDTAKKQRPDLLSSEESQNAAWHRRNMTFLSNLPTISATGSLSYDLSDSARYNVYDDGTLGMSGPNDRLGASIGIRASMPIFAGFSNLYNARAAEVNYEKAQEQYKSKQNTVAQDIWSAFQNFQTAQKVLEQTDTLVKSAKESESVTAGMYKVGRATMLEWQTQQTALADARRQNISAKYDLFVKRAALALAAGELKEELDNSKSESNAVDTTTATVTDTKE